MKFGIVLAALSLSVVSYAQSRVPQRGVRSEIFSMTAEINQAVRNDEFSDEQLQMIADGLRATLDSVSGPVSSGLICSKQSNGLFYPTNPSNGNVVGSGSSNAGYLNFEDCKSNLPARGAVAACFKQNNGLFYPTNPQSGNVIGSSSSNAGHLNADSCRMTLPKRGDTLACYKQNNGLYYPSNPKTGDVVGSGSSNAGYLDLNSCLKVISQ